MSPSEATLHLPNSKTDTTGRGVDVPLVCNGTATSSLHAMRQYLGVDESYVGPLDNGHRPLFMMPSLTKVSVPLSRGTFLIRLRQALDSAGLNPASYSGHSMRKGGAQSLFDAGVSTADIARVAGRSAPPPSGCTAPSPPICAPTGPDSPPLVACRPHTDSSTSRTCTTDPADARARWPVALPA